MHNPPIEYLMLAGIGSADIAAALCTRRHARAAAVLTVQRRYYDTFDWALYRAGVGLEWRLEQEQGLLVLHPLSAAPAAPPMGALLLQPGAGAPGLLDSIPEGALRERLAPLLGVRRLLPMAALASRVERLRLSNQDDETVAWVAIETHRLIAPEAKPGDAEPEPTLVASPVASPVGSPAADSAAAARHPPRARLQIWAVGGHAAERDALARLIEEELGLNRAEQPLLLDALAAAGCEPGGYLTKPNHRLRPDQPTDQAVRAILQRLLRTLEANVAGARANLDPEFLHDLRVATRRTRSALTQLRGVFPAAVVEDFKARFAWLQQVTGPVRDLDVWLQRFPELQGRLPVGLRADLEPLREFLQDHYRAEQARLAAALSAPAFVSLCEDWRQTLEILGKSPDMATGKGAEPVKPLVDKRLRKLFKQVRRDARAINEATPASALHELRKRTKKLRYLLEFFHSLYPKEPARMLIRESKAVLDPLGRYQDLAVQAETLRRLAEEMRQRIGAETATLLAIGALLGILLQEQTQLRADLGPIMARFDSGAHRAQLRALLASRA